MAISEQTLTPPLTGRLWLLGALFLVTLPHLERMPLWFSAACLFVLGWRLLHELRGYALPGRLLRYVLIFIGIAAVAGIYRGLLGQQAAVALLTLMLCLKLLELHTMRDAMIALFIGYFMVVSGFLFSQSIFMGGYLFIVVLALTAALVALNHPHGKASDRRLYLATGGKLLLQAIPLMLLMFILFPRLSNPLWGVPENNHSARTGLSDTIEMGTISNLVQSEDVAFRVDFHDDIPSADKLYWRGPVLWQTDGRRWKNRRLDMRQQPGDFEALGGEVDYTVTLEPHSKRWLFALDLPLSLPQPANTKVYTRDDFQLLSSKAIHQKLRYRVRSATFYRLQGLPHWMETAATALPDDANPRTRKLAREWLDEGLDDETIIQRGYNLFRNQPFYYTRRPPLLDENPVDQFLFTTRRGFCEHYATAYVTLMRAAGIPARVVTGYQGGELNEMGDYLIVRQSNAHAWTEVWLKDKGWVRLDPTTAVPPSRVESDTDASRFASTTGAGAQKDGNQILNKLFRTFRHGWDAINHQWNQWVLGFDRDKQRELLKILGLNKLSWESLIGIMVTLIASALLFIAAITLLRRPPQRDPVLRLYQQFCQRLEKAGFTRRSDEGPDDFTARVIAQRPDLADAVKRINQLYVRLRYARVSRDNDLDLLRKLVHDFQAVGRP
ncbi:MAG: DUF3488 and transglutaminase-like domain-containing protein [Pseudomonadota bacterium]